MFWDDAEPNPMPARVIPGLRHMPEADTKLAEYALPVVCGKNSWDCGWWSLSSEGCSREVWKERLGLQGASPASGVASPDNVTWKLAINKERKYARTYDHSVRSG